MENDYIVEVLGIGRVYRERGHVAENDALLGKISREQNVKISQIRAVLQLIEGGATVPFIARYRKEVTGGLDEEQIRAIYTEWDYGQKLAQRKEDVMRLIEEKGKLTPELKEAIIKATKLAEIEDIYRPFKEKKKTRATDAKKKGLDPLAEYLLSFPLEGDVEKEAEKYVTDLEGKTEEEIEAMKKEGVIDKLIETHVKGHTDGSNPEPVVIPVIDGAETVKVAVTGDIPPIDFVAADGTPAGFNMALLAEIAKKVNVNIEIVQVDTGARVAALTSGRADVLFWVNSNSCTVHGEFEKGSDIPDGTIVTEPYFTESISFVTFKQ